VCHRASSAGYPPSSVSNGFGSTPSGQDLDRKNGSDWFQTHPNTRPVDSWLPEPGPVPVNPGASAGSARPGGSKFWLFVTGFTFMVAIRYATVNSKILPLVHHRSFSTYQLPWCAKQAYIFAQPHTANERQQRVNYIWSFIFGIVSGAWFEASINKDMAACIGRYVRDILVTSSGTVTTYFIYRSTTKYSWAI